jgi:small subunit ribosomal protein S8
MINDIISDFLARIRNSLLAKHEILTVSSSKMLIEISSILLKEGYLLSFKKKKDGFKKYIKLELKYDKDNRSVITGLKRLSKSGLRIYSSAKNIPVIRNGMGINIISTSRGVMSCKNARKENIGGELICAIW